MRFIHKLLNPFNSNSRFDRYYGSVLRQGEGYPTADEARQDIRNQNAHIIGWMR